MRRSAESPSITHHRTISHIRGGGYLSWPSRTTHQPQDPSARVESPTQSAEVTLPLPALLVSPDIAISPSGSLHSYSGPDHARHRGDAVGSCIISNARGRTRHVKACRRPGREQGPATQAIPGLLDAGGSSPRALRSQDSPSRSLVCKNKPRGSVSLALDGNNGRLACECRNHRQSETHGDVARGRWFRMNFGLRPLLMSFRWH